MTDGPDGRTSTRSGAATIDALVDAAEQLFADDGFERASLRAVMRAAGSDPGAVHYHFGGRPELAAGVLDRILAPLNAHRLELLDRLVGPSRTDDRSPTPVEVPRLVDALIRPDLEAAADLESRGPGRARLIGAIYLNPAAFVTERVEAHFRPVAQRFQPELARSIPDVSPDVVAWRIRWIVFGTLGAVLSDPTEALARPVDSLAARLTVDFAAVLAAPSGDPPETGADTDTRTSRRHSDRASEPREQTT